MCKYAFSFSYAKQQQDSSGRTLYVPAIIALLSCTLEPKGGARRIVDRDVIKTRGR